LKTEAT